ncbi:MAG: adenylate/guanylate cyclase domain-containing protein [Solirubrobacteraceae bacterium]|jgi:adenylate cyclase
MAQTELHTFLFADLCGYSLLTELDGDEAAAELAIRFASEVTRIAEEHGAEVVKSIGDAVMVHCSNAAEAIELGLRLHREMGTGAEIEAFPPIHSGIHSGPALNRAGDWWGATVNVAARVAAAAEAGQLLVTEATKQAAEETRRTHLRELGHQRLKNISAPVRVYSPSDPERSSVAGALQPC